MTSTKGGWKAVVLGARGMLGKDLVSHLGKHGEVIPLGRGKADITDPPAIQKILSDHEPLDWVLNSAAYTDVDGAESHPDEAFAVNRDGAAAVAWAASEQGVRLIHFSTDFVFDGTKDSPYTEKDPARPLGVYGRSKWEGEELLRKICKEAIIIRTSWTFGGGRPNFVEKILNLASKTKELRVVSDQRGSPTYTADLAGMVLEFISQRLPGGIYHVTNRGTCTRVEQAEKILELAGSDSVRVVPVLSDEFPTPAARPKNSVLGNAVLETRGMPLLRPWEEALADYLTTRNS
ncbi:MAG: dTDP-4-dehydrorhamnose reductase [Planctomycetota bacterium]|nr:dTDP-4-dehydrorhamnose reductase [Planctomycetota bacterium]